MIKINQEYLNANYQKILEETISTGHAIPLLLIKYGLDVPNSTWIEREVGEKFHTMSDEANEIFNEETFNRDKTIYKICHENGDKRKRKKLLQEYYEQELMDWLKIFPQYNMLIE